ncbi:ABC transporter ATP-binding protein [Lactobacillus sp. ESL0791]|uniref:ATP-binding cassette domain-containing protein n=1 Tax=Lactobacillus sp. ESL0791 TaxID=2983234 RepID=UPI0023F943A8|nr:ABC transporter ATP-binding protein [Lactobacillus sp. ESL0791]MDF7639879.1 ABC transporter ATP-binding protein [Lactobacillus sp. ESL0791]
MKQNLMTKVRLGMVWLLGIVGAAAEFILARLLGTLDVKMSVKQFVFYGSLLIVSCLVIIAAKYGTSFLTRKLLFTEEKQLSDKIIGKVQEELAALNKGKWLTLILTDTNVAGGRYASTLTNLLIGGSSFIAAIIFGLFTSWQLTLIILFLCLLSLIGPKFFNKLIIKSRAKQQMHQEKLQEVLTEIINSREFIMINQQEKFTEDLFQRQYRQFLKAQYRNAMTQQLMLITSTFFGLLFDCLTLVIEIYMISQKMLTVPQFVSFSILTNSLTWVFYEAPYFYSEFNNQKVSEDRIRNFLKQGSVKNQLTYNRNNEFGLENITFGYDNTELPFKNLSFKVNLNKHSKYLIYGKSGCGKSTLLNIMSGALQLKSGSISIPQEISSLRQLVTLVPQVNSVFSGTIKENIILGRDIATERINTISDEIGLTNLIKNFKGGLDYQLTTGDENISAGQKQLIGIARALVASHELLLLDEPLANLDTRQTVQLTDYLARTAQTVIMVSHRLPDKDKFTEIELKGGKLGKN